VRTNLQLGVPWNPFAWLRPILSLTYVTNTGVAFGMAQGLGWVSSVIAVLVTGILIYYNFHLPASAWLTRVSMGLQMGGALGNVVDRVVLRGHVTDFFDLNFWPLREWPVANVADVCVVTGTCMLAYLMFTEREWSTAAADAPTVPGGEDSPH
jgi:signal peptidase II